MLRGAVLVVLVAALVLAWCLVDSNASGEAPKSVTNSPSSVPPRETSEMAAPLSSSGPVEDLSVNPVSEVDRTELAARVSVRNLGKDGARAYARLQQVLKEQGLPALPEDGFIRPEDMAALTSAVATFDAEIERTYAEVTVKVNDNVARCRDEIRRYISKGEPPPYEVYHGQRFSQLKPDMWTISMPANHDKKYLIRTPRHMIESEAEAFIAAEKAEADFADKTVRNLIEK